MTMLFEIVLYVNQRMAGRVMVGDGEITAVIENGVRREPKSKSFKAAVRHLMDNTDLVIIDNQPEQIGRKSYFTTYRYTYRKPGVYVNSRHDKWAVAHPVENHWMVRKVGKETETRFESQDKAMCDVDSYVGYDFVKELHRRTVEK